MTDPTGAGHQSASTGQTGDVNVADESRPDITTDVQTGGASDVGAGGPEPSSAGDESGARGPEDVDGPRRDEPSEDDDTSLRDDDEAASEERQKSAEEFAREHDPAKHDVSAGEEFRQSGDWTADDAGGSQVWDAEGNLVEGSSAGQGSSTSPAE
ncbi:MAG TPA: hypothetical protein VNS83_02140 [Lapillicoccus sp.]|nr:hypothetical protein [Lapillicoccus sp.]